MCLFNSSHKKSTLFLRYFSVPLPCTFVCRMQEEYVAARPQLRNYTNALRANSSLCAKSTFLSAGVGNPLTGPHTIKYCGICSSHKIIKRRTESNNCHQHNLVLHQVMTGPWQEVLHTAWLDNHALTLKSNSAKYYFYEKSRFLHTFLKFCCESRKI